MPLWASLLDHPARHVLQNIACHLPGASRAQRARTVTGALNKPSVMADWASLIAKDVAAAGKDVRGAKMLEIGPGHSLGVAFGLLSAGATEIYAVDVEKYCDLSDLRSYEDVVNECKKTGFGSGDAKDLVSGLSYRLVGHDGKWPIKSASVDVAYSYFAGEHLRHPVDVLSETHRVLKPGGICVFAIDLTDHFHADENWQQMLYYEPWLWEAMTSKRGKWTNRLMSPEWRAIFESQFTIIRFREDIKEAHPSFDRNRLASPFRKYDTQTLSVCGLWVVASRPSGPN
jgi:SAM-dependent methyltransferase